MKTITIYVTENRLNGKKYVGFHKTDKVDDNYFGSGKLIKRAIEKYGKENFIKTPLLIVSNVEEGHYYEERIIKELNTMIPNGYNLSPSGGTHKGGRHHMTSKQLITGRPKVKVTYEQIRDFLLENPYISLYNAGKCLNIARSTIRNRFIEQGYMNYDSFKKNNF